MKEYYSSERIDKCQPPCIPTSENSQRKIDSDGILSEVRRNFEGEKYKNILQNLRFTRFSDKNACPIMISNYTGVKKRSFPDAIGIGFAKSGTGSLAMLRSVCLIETY